jgi:hypothetical protein
MSKLNGAIPGALFPSLLKVLGPVGAAATAYQVCDSLIKAGCWLFKRNSSSNSTQTSTAWVIQQYTVTTTGDACGVSGFPPFASLKGQKVECVTAGGTAWKLWSSRQTGISATGLANCTQSDTGIPSVFSFTQYGDNGSCYDGGSNKPLIRGLYWRSMVASDSITGPGEFDPAGVPLYNPPAGEPNFAPAGEDAAADAMADKLAADDELVQNLAGAAVAEALPSEPTPEVEPAPVPEGQGAVVPAFSGKTWTEYQSALAELGLKIKLGVVGQAAASPELGANAVLTANPQPGERVASGSTVSVLANPPAMAPAAGAAPAEAPADNGIASPQEDAPLPAVDLSPLNVGLADKFPFGVPGWVAAKLGGFGGGGSCPVFRQDLPFGREIEADGCVIEPARAIYRPVLVVCSFIGLAWMFMGAAMGFGAGSNEE